MPPIKKHKIYYSSVYFNVEINNQFEYFIVDPHVCRFKTSLQGFCLQFEVIRTNKLMSEMKRNMK